MSHFREALLSRQLRLSQPSISVSSYDTTTVICLPALRVTKHIVCTLQLAIPLGGCVTRPSVARHHLVWMRAQGFLSKRGLDVALRWPSIGRPQGRHIKAQQLIVPAGQEQCSTIDCFVRRS